MNTLDFKKAKKIAEFLTVHKHVKNIYLNDAGDYHLHPVAGFQKVSADEFLNDLEVYGAEKTEEIVLETGAVQPGEGSDVDHSIKF